MNQELVFQVSDFVEYFNQTIEYAYGNVSIEGEITNLKVSKNKWVYFDLKDDDSSVKFFGSIYNLPGPVEDGMIARVVGTPKLHNLYGFSVTFRSISLVGEGSIKKAAEMLRIKLKKEGLFDDSRKRAIPSFPNSIGLVTSVESAAYNDFIKILGNRWGGIKINVLNVGVQGFEAVEQNVQAVEYFNLHPELADILVITRGGGSKDDLSVYDDERLVRAVAGSKTPTLVAIGHEVDTSLAELVSDRRASTPSNAAELLTPDKREVIDLLGKRRIQIRSQLQNNLDTLVANVRVYKEQLEVSIRRVIDNKKNELLNYKELLRALSPEEALKRGYSVIRYQSEIVNTVRKLKVGQELSAELYDGSIDLEIKDIKVK